MTAALPTDERDIVDRLAWSIARKSELDRDKDLLRAALKEVERLRALPAPQAHAVAWQFISSPPSEPVQVEFFYGNAHAEMIVAPYRDERRELGYWDGQTWRHCGTGHEVYEFEDTIDEHLPTHWRPLPAAPALVAEQSEVKS